MTWKEIQEKNPEEYERRMKKIRPLLRTGELVPDCVALIDIVAPTAEAIAWAQER